MQEKVKRLAAFFSKKFVLCCFQTVYFFKRLDMATAFATESVPFRGFPSPGRAASSMLECVAVPWLSTSHTGIRSFHDAGPPIQP
jgi:hypothetical protein